MSTCSVAEEMTRQWEWCEANDFPGANTHPMLTDLPMAVPHLRIVVTALDARFLRAGFEFDSRRGAGAGRHLINILPEGGIHTSHIHPYRSPGTTYVKMPFEGASR
jgi:hypothetical protein